MNIKTLSNRIAAQYQIRTLSRIMPTRILGHTGLYVQSYGLGGQGLLEHPNCQKQALDLINKALDLGVNYLDTAAIYGPSRYYYGRSIKGRNGLVLASKVRERGYAGAKRELDETFQLLQVPYIDIMQLHTIENQEDKRALKKDGALQVLIDAQKAGKVGFIGISGHYDPDILCEFMDEYPFDTVLTALNPTIPHFDKAVNKARSLNMGVIAMKVMSRGILTKVISPEQLIHYAMKRADVVITGCSSESDVENSVRAASLYRDGIEPEIPELSTELIEEATYFIKGHKPCKWPSTYQPDWPKILYDQ